MGWRRGRRGSQKGVVDGAAETKAEQEGKEAADRELDAAYQCRRIADPEEQGGEQAVRVTMGARQGWTDGSLPSGGTYAAVEPSRFLWHVTEGWCFTALPLIPCATDRSGHPIRSGGSNEVTQANCAHRFVQ